MKVIKDRRSLFDSPESSAMPFEHLEEEKKMKNAILAFYL